MVVITMFSVLVSCEKEDDEGGENKDLNSRYNENESHNAGQNCMACHHSPENTQCARCHSKQSALYTAQNLPVKIRYPV